MLCREHIGKIDVHFWESRPHPDLWGFLCRWPTTCWDTRVDHVAPQLSCEDILKRLFARFQGRVTGFLNVEGISADNVYSYIVELVRDLVDEVPQRP